MQGPTQDSPILKSRDRALESNSSAANQRGLVILLIVVTMTAAVSITIVFVEFGLIVLAIALGMCALLIKDQLVLSGQVGSSTRKRTNSTRQPFRSPQIDAAEPLSFRRRLATYLHVPESEVLPPRPQPVSTMPFWSAVPLSRRPVVLKSVEFIRAILERIRATVHS